MRNSRAPAGFRPNGWPFGLQSRSRLGTFEPAKSMESGEVLALGNPCETAEPQALKDLRPLKARWRIVAADTCELRATRQKVKASAILQRRSRLGTFEPAKNLESGEVLALGNPCETAEPLQDSGPMGGRLVCRADLVWAPLNPLKAWRVERYWRWATHAKQQSLCRIQAQWVAVWSAEPISFGHL